MSVLLETGPAVVVDADVASFFVNDDPVRVPRYEPHLEGRRVITPFAALAEMLFGAELRQWGPLRRAKISTFIARGSVYYPDERVCELWAELRAAAQRQGRHLPVQDAWMAAVVVYLDLPLVSHNGRHYARVPGCK